MRVFIRSALLVSMLALAVPGAAQRLTVLTHDSFALPKELVDDFTARTGIAVTFLQGGDAGEVVNRAVLTRARPLADVLFGVDESLLQRVRAEGIFEPYLSPALARVDPAFRFDPSGLVTPIDVGYVVPNVDVGWFAANDLPWPSDLADLAAAPYRGLTVVLNPASSSPGLAFLAATVARFGDPQAGIVGTAGGGGDWLDFWADLAKNDVAVADGWTDAYYTRFTRYGGDRPIVVSYATSPAAEVIFADAPLSAAPTANLTCAGCAYRQVEAAGILAGTKQRAAAEAFIDFLLSPAVQSAIPLAMFVAPVVADAPEPPEFLAYGRVAPGAVATPLAPGVLEANQARWLKQWTAVVLQGRLPSSVR